VGTLVGSSLSNFVIVNAGSHLTELTSLRDLYSAKVVLLIAGLALLTLCPVYLRHRWEQSREWTQAVRSD